MEISFLTKIDFWVFLILAIGSLIASIKAFTEAQKAKDAAYEAGKTVKIQTITIELSEIIVHLDKLDLNIGFSAARDLLNETNRKIRRLTAPFKDKEEYKEITSSIFITLEVTQKALAEVRPIDNQEVVVKGFVYYSIESSFSLLSGQLAELMGKFEERTIQR